MRRSVDWLNAVVEGVYGVQLAAHLCRRSWGRGGRRAAGDYEATLGALRRLWVGQLVVEFSIPAAGDVAVLVQLPEYVEVGLGYVNVRFPEVEPSERIAGWVEQAPTHVVPEQLRLRAGRGPRHPAGGGVPQVEEARPPAPRGPPQRAENLNGPSPLLGFTKR
jgi:methionine synthase II (cobalamin-independent)